MATLYELTGQFLDIYNLELDEETKRDTLDSIDWETEYETKVENYIKVMKNLEADIEARKNEIKRLMELNKADEKKKEHLKDTLSASMSLTGHERVDTPLFKVSFRKSQAVEVDEAVLPEDYKVATWKVDKKRLKEDLKKGLEIIGASLVERKNLSIR
ncbi:siphovirus Gp157 family protein [Streptococcus sp. Marseille-Q5986]|uniref:siphovirus Gp157 family protein n=1 Tax=Streptococcus sp. Marseille-Q5986 TaxID=2972782 RepID=UPI002263F635|nr:siphovirus Gp157 family protein [Streptococcus sp. Marseille-Q5986]